MVSMNRLLILATVFSLAITTLNAQYVVGIEAGLGNAWFKISDYYYHAPQIDNDLCYSLGIFYKERRERTINIGFEMEYMFKSFDSDLNCSSRSVSSFRTLNYKTGYLSFYFLPEIVLGKKLKYIISAGPYLGILLHSHKNGSGEYTEWVNPGNHKDYTIDGSANADFSNLNIGLKAITGLEIPVKNRIRLFALLGYKIGANIAQGGDLCPTGLKLYPQVIDISVGIGYLIHNSNMQKFTDKIFN